MAVSADTEGASGNGADRSELYCEYTWPWLGSHACRSKGDGGIVEAGGGTEGSRRDVGALSGSAEECGER